MMPITENEPESEPESGYNAQNGPEALDEYESNIIMGNYAKPTASSSSTKSIHGSVFTRSKALKKPLLRLHKFSGKLAKKKAKPKKADIDIFKTLTSGFHSGSCSTAERNNRLHALRLCTAISSSSFSEAREDTPMTVLMELLFQLVSPFGLLGNLASIMSLADHWRVGKNGSSVPDLWWIYLLNSLGLFFGCMANLVLFLHMELWLNRSACVMLTALFYMMALVIYMIMLGVVESIYFYDNSPYLRTVGYWQASCASVLYMLGAGATISCAIYFRKRKWNTTVSRRQRLVMLLCLLYAIWIGGGGAVFQKRNLLNKEYTEAVYFVVVSCLTLGYGDVVPQNNLSKALDIPLIYIGLLIGGWVAFAIFQGNMSKAQNSSIHVRVQRMRRKALKLKPNEKDSFTQMRSIVRGAQLYDQMLHASLTLMWLVVFWLCGALVFTYTENWTYFNAFYMCAISLTGVGYGDYVPTSPGGRAMFIHWALFALPTMAAAVSDLSSFIAIAIGRNSSLRMHLMSPEADFSMPNSVSERLNRIGVTKLQMKLMTRIQKRSEAEHIPKFFLDDVAHRLPKTDAWRAVVLIARKDDSHLFTFETWNRAVCLLLGTSKLPESFWLSENSPLRHATINEKRFLETVALLCVNNENEVREQDYYQRAKSSYKSTSQSSTRSTSQSSGA